jgi:hypothetical protein
VHHHPSGLCARSIFVLLKKKIRHFSGYLHPSSNSRPRVPPFHAVVQFLRPLVGGRGRVPQKLPCPPPHPPLLRLLPGWSAPVPLLGLLPVHRQWGKLGIPPVSLLACFWLRRPWSMYPPPDRPCHGGSSPIATRMNHRHCS